MTHPEPAAQALTQFVRDNLLTTPEPFDNPNDLYAALNGQGRVTVAEDYAADVRAVAAAHIGGEDLAVALAQAGGRSARILQTITDHIATTATEEGTS